MNKATTNTDPGYMKPIISVDRRSKSIACFDGLVVVRKFEPYIDESIAIQQSHEWFRDKTIHVPQVVYPLLTKIKMS